MLKLMRPYREGCCGGAWRMSGLQTISRRKEAQRWDIYIQDLFRVLVLSYVSCACQAAHVSIQEHIWCQIFDEVTWTDGFYLHSLLPCQQQQTLRQLQPTASAGSHSSSRLWQRTSCSVVLTCNGCLPFQLRPRSCTLPSRICSQQAESKCLRWTHTASPLWRSHPPWHKCNHVNLNVYF